MDCNGVQILISNLCKTFDQHVVLENLNFAVNPSESVTILGQSGTGKSVFMQILGTLLEATSGSVKINNQEVVGISQRNREILMRKVGFLFQNASLFDHLTIWENVAFRELYVLKIKPSIAKEMAIFQLEQVGIKNLNFNLKPNNISGGTQKRVAMARTLMKKPHLILLDEPTSGLDPVVADIINELIVTTKNISKATMITITHDLNSALFISDRIFMLYNGKFIWNGKPNDIFMQNDSYIKHYVKSTNLKKDNF